MRDIILIHGIGDHKPDWADSAKVHEVFNVPEDKVVEFWYEDLLEESLYNKLPRLVIKTIVALRFGDTIADLADLPQDYLCDIVAYFFDKKIRKRILERLREVLAEHPGAIILAHSLGSVVAFEARPTENHVLMTLGSPLSKWVVKKQLVTPSRPPVKAWFNIYGTMDPIGGKIKGLGCHPLDQYKISNAHEFEGYVEAAARIARSHGVK